jgi:L-iditol 2-dehydrogenase
MRALYLTGARRLELRDAPEPPAPRSDEVLLRVVTVGICGSDLHYYRTGRIGDQVVEFPWMLGHECSAVVEQTGDEVESLSVGDRVAVDPLVWCNECDQCLAGRVHTCRNQKFLGCPGQMQGCLCDRIVMPAQSCFRIPDELTMTQAALVEPFSIGLYSRQLGGEDLAGKSVAILGSGPIGLSVLLACRAAGADKIYMTDLLDYRNDRASSMGADWTGNPDRQDVVREILGQAPLGVHFAFECAGEQETTDQGLEIVRPGGSFMMVGIPEFDRMSFDFSILRRKEITVQPVRRQNHCVSPAIEMAASGAVDLDPMVTHEMSLEQSVRGFEILDDYSDDVVKVMVHVSEED